MTNNKKITLFFLSLTIKRKKRRVKVMRRGRRKVRPVEKGTQLRRGRQPRRGRPQRSPRRRPREEKRKRY